MSDDFSDLGMGPGVKPGATGADIRHLLPENQPRGEGAVYDRAIRAGATHEQAQHEVAKSVYGHDFRQDKQGRPIVQGIGAPGNENGNHFAAIRKWQGEVRYQAALKEIWKRDPNHARRIGLEEPDRASA
jgi:hypothetical protein